MLRQLLLGAAAGTLLITPNTAMGGQDENPSLTVFPVIMAGKPMKDVGAVVGLMLEKAGMDDIELADAEFRGPPESSLADVAARLIAVVRERSIKTDYALYAEVLGSPKVGVKEVRVVVVDREGALVWVDRQRPGDPAFDRARPRNPMTCCVLVSQLFKTRFGVTGTRPDNGKLARYWEQKSGMPSSEERAAMKKRRASLEAAGGNAVMVVFPAHVGEKADKGSAAHLVETLNGRKLCRAEVATAQPYFKLTPGRNEQKRLWDLARAFRQYVRSNPPTAEYALHAEYVIAPNKGVWSVHFIVCDRAGEWVIVDYQNEHHADFKSVDPKTLADCDLLVAKRLAGH